MSITCQICQQVFEKIIPWQHVRTHDMTTAEYKTLYGQLYSDQTRERFRARVPHNKGKTVTDQDQLETIRRGIESREQKYQQGQWQRSTAPRSSETKTKISAGVKAYAQDHSDLMRLRAQKAVATKRSQGPVVGPMTGKTHSAATKQKLQDILTTVNERKRIASWQKIQAAAHTAQITITGQNGVNLNLQCQVCLRNFVFTRQYFNTAKFRTSLCPFCHPTNQNKTSLGQLELFQFVQSLCPTAVQNYRTHYHSPEIDIFIPELQLGFEFHGLYWHSEAVLIANNKSPKNDWLKYCYWQERSVRLIQIYEDEWADQRLIVQSRIKHILGKITTKIPARKCVVKSISSQQASEFFNATHIMGHGRSNLRLGLFHGDQLIAAMSFSKNNLSRKITDWELNRFSGLPDIHVMGGASKLFQHFVRQVQPTQCVSYSDNRWSQGQVYEKMGFVKTSPGSPNYWYFLPNQSRIHRFNLRKTAQDDPTVTESVLRAGQGYQRIWDSGSAKWIWKK